jgi:hypothetical protein
VILALVFTLGVLELGARLIRQIKSPTNPSTDLPVEANSTANIFQVDPKLGWSHKPGGEMKIEIEGIDPFVAEINSLGVYDQAYDYERPDDGFRVLVIGDSYVESLQVPLQERSFQQLENRYAAASSTPYEIIENGVARYCPQQYHLYYVIEGYRYEADVVIVVFFLGNDLSGVHPDSMEQFLWFGVRAEISQLYTLENGELVLLDADQWHPPEMASSAASAPSAEESAPSSDQQSLITRADIFLVKHSVFYGIMSREIIEWPVVRRVLSQAGVISRTIPKAANFQSGYEDEISNQSWLITEALLTDLRDQVEADGAEFAVVIAPDMYTIYPDWFFEDNPGYESYRDQFDPYKIENRLTTLLDEHHINAFSLTPALEAAAESTGEPLYYRGNNHWTTTGHDVVTEALDKWFQEQGWSPDRIRQ